MPPFWNWTVNAVQRGILTETRSRFPQKIMMRDGPDNRRGPSSVLALNVRFHRRACLSNIWDSMGVTETTRHVAPYVPPAETQDTGCEKCCCVTFVAFDQLTTPLDDAV